MNCTASAVFSAIAELLVDFLHGKKILVGKNEKTQITDKNTQKPRRHRKKPRSSGKNPAVATLGATPLHQRCANQEYSFSWQVDSYSY